MTYPVTVVIPTIESRYEFLVSRCLPSVKAARPAQIVVVFGDENGNMKRNNGAKAATQPFLLFVDDDSTIEQDCLKAMVSMLELDQSASFAFSDYRVIVDLASGAYCNPSGDMFPGNWDVGRLCRGNYIDVTSLIRREHFPWFDPKIQRFQDWDLWLTMGAAGYRGRYIAGRSLFTKFVIDQGVTTRISESEAREAILRKHDL